jgi:carboxymethylenebutenolidase
MQTVNSQISLHVADGTEAHAYTASPSADGKFPGIILLQEAFGVTPHIKGLADRLAAEGYVVIAPELFHRTAGPGAEFSYSDWGAITPHYTGITLEGLQADLHAAYGWLQGQDNVVKEKIGSIGFCLGGRVSFIANFTLPLSAGVSYYGGGTHAVADRAKDIHGAHLFFWGGLDTHILPEYINAVTTALKEHNKAYTNVVFSDAEHAFNNNERPSYNADASSEAWALTLAFFKNKLK